MKKKIVFLLTVLVPFYSFAQTPQFQWVKTMGDTLDDRGNSIGIGKSGNVYTCGYFEGEVDFDPNVGVTNLSASNQDVYIQKLDTAGNLIWVRHINGAGDFDIPSSIYVDNYDNCYITGYFKDSADFDPGVGVVQLYSEGTQDIFILKLDSAGNFVWAQKFGGPLTDNGVCITVDQNENVYTTGSFSDTADFDPNIGTSYLYSKGGSDIFIQKLDKNGNLLWVKQLGGLEYNIGTSISIDKNSNVISTGGFRGSVDFDPGVGVNILSTGAPDIPGAFVLKLDSNGSFIWAKHMPSNSNNPQSVFWHTLGNSVDVDNEGNIYTTGRFEGSVDFDPSIGSNLLTSNTLSDIFVQKLNDKGNHIWTKTLGSAGNDFGVDIYVDSFGRSFTTGYFSDSVDFDPGPNTSTLTAKGFNDMFILSLDSSGNFLWNWQCESSFFSTATSIYNDRLGNVYTTGVFRDTTNFNPGSNSSSIVAVGEDIFVLKLKDSFPNPSPNSISTIQKSIAVQLFPNPNNGNFSLKVQPNEKILSAQLVDINGKILRNLDLKSKQNIYRFKVDAPSGIYFINIQGEGGRVTLKLIKR